ncbi:MAG: precorrin-3B C(17)-methyltransferase [Chloroflexi bacterium]|nr:precorrin-3B C(17)-methyltransferase [Chloroflexota bacterium]
MARVGRLAGAILAETGARYFLIGNPKEPCDFEAAGFEDPDVIDALARPFVELRPKRPIELAPPVLQIAVEGDSLPRLLAERFVIVRNASVSDRLWRLILDPEATGDEPSESTIDARWLGDLPAPIWAIVRDAVLRCL